MMAKPAFNLRALLALTATFVLAACVSSASAAVPQWYTGTTSTNGTLLTGSEPLAMKSGETGMNLVIQSFFTQELVVKASGMECVSCSIVNRPASAGALGKGKLKLTKASISSIPNCQIASELGQAETVTTKQLEWEPVTAGGKQYVLFRPAEGGSTVLQFKISGPGCEAVAGAYNVSGVFSAEPNGAAPLNVPFKTHNLTFGQQADKAVGSSMKFGTSKGWFEGTAINSLPSGKYWYAN